ncbi:MAG TPA: hypothetical protein VJZ91_12220, partial [Blastocatellia bacterium]|nr:hypothetical protein [Blastocatellia bacterium]
PVSAAEVLALNFAIEDSQRDAATTMGNRLLASTAPLDLQLTAEPGLRMGDQVWSDEPVTPLPTVCAKSVRRAPRVAPRESGATTFAAVQAEKVDAQAMVRARAVKTLEIRKESLREVERTLATYRVDFEQAMRAVPQDLKFTIKVKPAIFPVPPAMTGCAVRKVLTPEKVKQLRAAWSLSFNTNAADAPDKGEL